MKKLFIFLSIFFVCQNSYAARKYEFNPHTGRLDAVGVSVSGDVTIACDDDAVLAYDTGTATWGCSSIGAGTGDITDVGDCATGACFNGSSGTTLTFNEASGDQTVAYNAVEQKFKFSKGINASGDSQIVGDLTFGLGANRSILLPNQTAANTAANDLTIDLGNGSGTGAGGDLKLFMGHAGATGLGGGLFIDTGNGGATSGNAGGVTITTGDGGRGGFFDTVLGAGDTDIGGYFSVLAGDGDSVSGTNVTKGGYFAFTGGDAITNGSGGYISMSTGDGGSNEGHGGDFSVSLGSAQNNGIGGSFNFSTGSGVGTNKDGGNYYFGFGSATGTGDERYFSFNRDTLISAEEPAVKFATAIDEGGAAWSLADGTTITNQRFFQFLAPTINGVAGGSAETITNPATVYIDAAPSGSDITLTNPYAFWVDSGTTRLDGTIATALTGSRCVETDASGNLTVAAGACGAAGAGDIDAVGDVASGAAFNGSAGTVLTFNVASGDQTIAISPEQGSIFTTSAGIKTSGDMFVVGGDINLGDTSIFSGGETASLNNIDAINATTETTLEAAIDTLANLTSIQSLTVTLADAGANAFFGWDDTAGAYENLTGAEAEAIMEPLIDTLINLTAIGTEGAATVFTGTELSLGNGATASGILKILEDSTDGSNFTTFQVPALAANVAYTLPADDGDAGEQLQTNGSGTLTWEAAGSGTDTNAVKEYWWPASSLLPIEAADSISPINKLSGTNIDELTVAFDSSTDECRTASFKVPSDVESGSTITFRAHWKTSIASADANVVWDWRGNAGASNSVSTDTALVTEAATVDSAEIPIGRLTVTTWTETLANLGWAANEQIDGVFCRDANNAADTASMDALVTGFGVELPRA